MASKLDLENKLDLIASLSFYNLLLASSKLTSTNTTTSGTIFLFSISLAYAIVVGKPSNIHPPLLNLASFKYISKHYTNISSSRLSPLLNNDWIFLPISDVPLADTN